MKRSRILPFLALLIVGCKDDGPGSDSAQSRPPLEQGRQDAVDASLSGQKIGGLLQGKISWFREDGYQKGPLDRAPELYLFYFSASW